MIEDQTQVREHDQESSHRHNFVGPICASKLDSAFPLPSRIMPEVLLLGILPVVAHLAVRQVYSILVVALFLVTELYPFVAALDSEVLLAMSADRAVRGISSTGEGNGGNGARGSGRTGEREGRRVRER